MNSGNSGKINSQKMSQYQDYLDKLKKLTNDSNISFETVEIDDETRLSLINETIEQFSWNKKNPNLFYTCIPLLIKDSNEEMLLRAYDYIIGNKGNPSNHGDELFKLLANNIISELKRRKRELTVFGIKNQIGEYVRALGV